MVKRGDDDGDVWDDAQFPPVDRLDWGLPGLSGRCPDDGFDGVPEPEPSPQLCATPEELTGDGWSFDGGFTTPEFQEIEGAREPVLGDARTDEVVNIDITLEEGLGGALGAPPGGSPERPSPEATAARLRQLRVVSDPGDAPPEAPEPVAPVADRSRGGGDVGDGGGLIAVPVDDDGPRGAPREGLWSRLARRFGLG